MEGSGAVTVRKCDGGGGGGEGSVITHHSDCDIRFEDFQTSAEVLC